MKATGRIILSCFTVLCLPAAVRAAPPLDISGNTVIIDEVYRTQVNLPADAQANEQTAKLVRRQLLKFLREAGYVLARVKARVENGRLRVEIDEGRLEKIVFLGAGTVRTLQAKLDVRLPGHVFNRPHLERCLAELRKRYGLQEATYHLMPVKTVRHRGPQLEQWVPSLEGLLPPPGSYELHITLSRPEWGVGLDVDLDYDFPDGASLGFNLREKGMLWNEDRWRLGARAGMKFREHLESGETFLSLSRLQSDAQWFTPAAWRHWRSFLWLFGEIETQQRPDLLVDLMYAAHADASLNTGLEFSGWMLAIGGGVSQRFRFGVEQLAGAAQAVNSGDWLRPFAGGQVELVFDPEKLRRDRRHRLQLFFRHFWESGESRYLEGKLEYQKTFEFGWHDLFVGLRGAWLYGDVPLEVEEPVGGRHLRGVFGDRWYVTEAGSLSLEFRFSLARDLFKISAFHDLGLFAELSRPERARTFRAGDSFGLGFHALVLDWLQFNIYYAVGFASDGSFDHGVSASLRKAF